MDYLMVTNNATGEAQLMSLEEAERVTQIDAHEIEWAIEAFGVCELLDCTITDTRPAEEIAAA